MSANILATKDKVQRFLADVFGTVTVDRDGDFVLNNGSAVCFVSVRPLGDENTMVRVYSLLLREVPVTPQLYEYLATNSFVFGAFGCAVADGKASINFGHTLLGDFLDPEELKLAVIMVAKTADEFDDQIKAQFGGKLFTEA